MAEVDLKGVGVALITPFNDDKSIDLKSLEIIIENLISKGCDYIVALGTTAETPTLNMEERAMLTKYVSQIVDRRVPLIIGIGGNCTQRVIQEINERDLSGYSAILSVTPYYNRPSQEGLYLHYKEIAKHSHLPIVLYNVPARTGVNLSHHTTLRLAKDFPNIIAIKEACGDIQQCQKIMEEKPDGFQLISGNDSDTVKMMKIGAKGVISVLANAMPETLHNLMVHCLEDEWEDAENLQTRLKSILGPLFEDGNPAGVKALMAYTLNLKNNLRLPLIPASREVTEKIVKSYNQFFN